ncbi:phosphate ABC transporter permease PstA [Paraconexibacter antarcticus]|uniref:Phosphate transport system permease protein PstA n=1 Tax=Paraconexibacter antarcticus TaxID=2949664 RepID=A0ABY5DQG4_9ACTN|nr:phosphate ABC transporter permease PstA [Paraconexibacter antarcticus]UTI63012.1 phosphate ABC transporter permease PstA [Paraconexibacter antarcticus]
MSTTEVDFTAPLVATGNLRRRHRVSRAAEGLALGSSVAAVAVLGIIVAYVVVHGAGALSLDFLTKEPSPGGGPGGGIAPAIVGTGLLVGVATVIAMPIGVLVAVYLTEFAGPAAARPIRLALDLLNGLPSIVVGLFVFGLLVVGKHQSGFAAAFALSIIMLPLIARSTQEMLGLVPRQLREAADALGVSRWRTVLTVVLPSAAGGIVTGTVLAVARAAGETAPLIFTSSIFGNRVTLDLLGTPIPNIPVQIFTLSETPDPSGYERAWGAAFVLLSFILVANIGARALLTRSRKKMGR